MPASFNHSSIKRDGPYSRCAAWGSRIFWHSFDRCSGPSLHPEHHTRIWYCKCFTVISLCTAQLHTISRHTHPIECTSLPRCERFFEVCTHTLFEIKPRTESFYYSIIHCSSRSTQIASIGRPSPLSRDENNPPQKETRKSVVEIPGLFLRHLELLIPWALRRRSKALWQKPYYRLITTHGVTGRSSAEFLPTSLRPVIIRLWTERAVSIPDTWRVAKSFWGLL